MSPRFGRTRRSSRRCSYCSRGVLAMGCLPCRRPGCCGKRASFSSALVEEMGPGGPGLRPRGAGGGIATCDGDPWHVLDGTRPNRCPNAPGGPVRGSMACWVHAVGLVRHRGCRRRVFDLRLCFSVWSLRVCLPLVNCSLTIYARTLLLPIALTASATVLYRIVSVTAPGHDVINVCLAATLATISGAVALIAQRRELLAVLSFSRRAA